MKAGDKVIYKKSVRQDKCLAKEFHGWYNGEVIDVYPRFIVLKIKPIPSELSGIGNAHESKPYTITVTMDSLKHGTEMIRRVENEAESIQDVPMSVLQG